MGIQGPTKDNPTERPFEQTEPEYQTYRSGATDYEHLDVSQQRLFGHAYHLWEKKATKIEAILEDIIHGPAHSLNCCSPSLAID